MMDRIFFAVAAALIAASSPSFADAISPECPKEGTVLTFNNQGSLKFTGHAGYNCVATVPDGHTVLTYLGIGTLDDFEKNHIERLFPLKIGNAIEFDGQADSSHVTGESATNTTIVFYKSKITVARQERITTPAGAFDTWVFEFQQTALGRIRGSWLTTFWWSPEIGYVVKATTQTSAGYGDDKKYELTAIKMPGSSAASSTPPASPPTASAAPGGAPHTSPPATTSASVQERLTTLKDLLDRRLITQSEYDTKRKAILDGL